MAEERPIMVEDDLAIRLPNHQILSTSVLMDAVRFYAYHGKQVKEKIDNLGVDIRELHEKTKNVHTVIQALNNLANDEGVVDLSNNPEIIECLNQAKQDGVNVPMNGDQIKTQYSAAERERLIENLHLQSDDWDKEIKNFSQKMQVHIQESERYLMLANQILKYETQAKKTALASMGGR